MREQPLAQVARTVEPRGTPLTCRRVKRVLRRAEVWAKESVTLIVRSRGAGAGVGAGGGGVGRGRRPGAGAGGTARPSEVKAPKSSGSALFWRDREQLPVGGGRDDVEQAEPVGDHLRVAGELARRASATGPSRRPGGSW